MWGVYCTKNTYTIIKIHYSTLYTIDGDAYKHTLYVHCSVNINSTVRSSPQHPFLPKVDVDHGKVVKTSHLNVQSCSSLLTNMSCPTVFTVFFFYFYCFLRFGRKRRWGEFLTVPFKVIEQCMFTYCRYIYIHIYIHIYIITI